MLRKINLILAMAVALMSVNLTFASVTLDVSTGVNVGINPNVVYTSSATRDDYWIARSNPSGNLPANTKSWLKLNMGGWNSIPGTLPIYANSDAGGTSEYERCFCISNLEGARLDITMRADNKANLFLNSYFGNPILTTATNDTFNNAKPAATIQYTAQNGLKIGQNCIRVRVNNESGPTGLAVKAIASVKAGEDTFQPKSSCCKQGARVFSEQFKVAADEKITSN